MTQKFFRFPVRIYDGFSLTRAIIKENKKFEDAIDPGEVDEPEQGDWVQGYARVQPNDIIGWVDHFEEGTPVADVAKQGFDMTLVITRRQGMFECVWKREKFEKMLDEFTKI